MIGLLDMTRTVRVARSIPRPNAGLWPGLAEPPHDALRARIARQLVKLAARKIDARIVFPDGTWWGMGDENAPRMDIIRPANFFHRLGCSSKIGFGEAYMVGDWTAGEGTDLGDLLLPFAERLSSIIPAPLRRFRRLAEAMQPSDEENTVAQAEANIQRHYDLSNDLFENFLDSSMMYSSALFDGTDDLTAAQARKVDAVLDYARVGPGMRVLEIGTGWGTLAIQAAQRGAHVTTVTLSQEQLELAEQRIADAGLGEQIDVRLQDYRNVEGQYDAVVSVEMIEAVGEKYWPTYFKKVDDLLAPGGRFGLQAITIGHQELLATRKDYTWIHKYVFPGGIIPSISAIEQTVAEHTNLEIFERRDFGTDYARTLRTWRERFNERWDTINDKGFDETFKRMWNFYLAYCEAGFASRYLGVSQFSIGRLTGSR